MASTKSQDAIALLKEDHRKVEDLFEQFEKAKGDGRKEKLALQICRQAINDLCAPAFPLLPIKDVAADLPIQKDKFAVYRNRGA